MIALTTAPPTEDDRCQWQEVLTAHPKWGRCHYATICDDQGAALVRRVAELEAEINAIRESNHAHNEAGMRRLGIHPNP